MTPKGENPIRGSCLCGAVRFEIDGKPLWMTRCHCTRCRKSGGGHVISVRAEQFRWIQGSELVTRYHPEPPYHIPRCFCGRCGTYLGEPDTSEKGFPIAANALDDDPGVTPILHEFVSEKAPWVEIGDDRPQYPGRPPAFGDPPAFVNPEGSG